MGLASQQNAGRQSSRTALAGDGGGPGLDGERRLPGGGKGAEARVGRVIAGTAYRVAAAEAAGVPAAAAPVELRRTGTPWISGCAVHDRGLAVRHTAGRSMA